MRVRQTQTRKRDAGLLAAGQEGHFLQSRRARDAKGAQVPAVLLVLLARVIFRHEGDGAGRHVEGVDVVLGEEADAEAGVLGDETGRGLEVADEEFEDGGLARAVGADDADARVELDVQVDVAEEGPVGRVAEGDARHLDDGRRELLHLGELEVHRVLALRGFQDGHLLEFLDPRLGFGGFGGVVAELVDEGLQVGSLGHLVLVLAFGRLAALFFGGVEGVEVGTFVVVEAFRVLVYYIGRHFVQKGPVVGDDKEGAGVGLEVAREEGDGGHVQHVGWFCQVSASILGDFQRRRTVKEEQVRLAEKCSGQCQPHPPTSRESLGGIVLLFFREA